ncbi:hypothetical protein C7445_12010 [Alicyclobacillus sacchari]|uniref:Uncharacterized protein n=1 Tax=Alicyclobacillus sacchari TaxID=392010 RepID=A0A4R8LC24_9BACL|nr:hypothetical protein [Alicyclobacillus sacchari]TDY40481.1 hypothetical protein C7445_12010 [Alicyclobacillus sacchari]GMA59511.1 hypothetical protein GCM10025858_40150 [Alicyclobacillus sacchari]
MKAYLRDSDILRRIPPRELAAYLRAQGWHQISRIGDKGAVWAKDEGRDTAEILLPLDPSLGDYVLRMSEALQILESVEGRSQLEILKDIETVSGDLIRVRVQRRDVHDGTVPLEEGVKLIQGVRDLLVAAASAAVSPKPYFHSRRPNRVTEYIQKVHLGQTEQGSFVVTALSRVTPELMRGQQMLLFDDGEPPFERQVTMKLADSLVATREAAEVASSLGVFDAFEEGVERGINANLCQALEFIGDEPEVMQVDVRFSWAPIRPISRPISSYVSFPSDMLPIIKEAGRMLKAISPVEDVELRGVVVNLARELDEDAGSVVVYGFLDGQIRRVKIHLSHDQYQLAIQAHDRKQPVVCYGELVREGNGFVLKSPRGFRIERVAEE